jgi:hypothetical protein
MTSLLDHPVNTAAPSDPASGSPTEASLLPRFVALLTPFFAIFAGAVAAYAAKHFSGVALDQTQVVAFMIAASSAALTAAWKWLQGWQQHEALVAAGQTVPRTAGPPVLDKRAMAG